MRRRLVAAGLLFGICTAASAATFVVKNTDDSGPGTLRQAIIDANADAVADQITFNISGVNVHTITPASPLPTITQPVSIDGYSQPGTNPNTLATGDDANLRIELNGSGLTGTSAIGLDLRAPGCSVRGLVINRFAQDGIAVADSVGATQIAGCFIGTDAAGTGALGNGTGILLSACKNSSVGGTLPADRNVIAGNITAVQVAGGNGSVVAGNYIGTERSGATALPSGALRLDGATNTIIGGTSAGSRNVILGFINIAASGLAPLDPHVGSANKVQGNFIGVNASGIAPSGSGGSVALTDRTFDNVIGGPTAAARNVIATSVAISGASSNLIQGNYIGTDATGMNAASGANGVTIATTSGTNRRFAAENTVDSNLICAPGRTALTATGASGTIITRNLIGVAADGVTPLGSPTYGISAAGLLYTSASATGAIGGVEPGTGNVIANALQDGISISTGDFYGADHSLSGNGPGANFRINGNSIYHNGGLGIDLVAKGYAPPPVTPNDQGDSDTGVSGLQNYPVLTFVSFSGGKAHIAGTLNSVANKTYRIELFGNSTADPSGYGQGKYFLGSTNVSTDASGNASFDVTLPCPDDTRAASSTATDPNGYTSEFSANTFAQLQNISTRARVQTGDNRMIGGFIVTGTDAKRVIVRAIGPSLQISGVPFAGRLENPVLDLFDGNGLLLASNDNWRDTQEAEIQQTGIAPANDLESAIVRSLPPGSYSAVMGGKDGTAGVGLVETYDLDGAVASKLANISTRAFVETGENVLIGGFIVGPPDHGSRVLVRALGPSLSSKGVPQPLQDPTLQLHNADGALLASNDDWTENQAQIAATGAAPPDTHESALVADVPAGNYTAVVQGKSGAVGVGLVEVYQLQ